MIDVVLRHIRPSREDDGSNFRITEFLALYRPRSDLLVTGDEQQVSSVRADLPEYFGVFRAQRQFWDIFVPWIENGSYFM